MITREGMWAGYRSKARVRGQVRSAEILLLMDKERRLNNLLYKNDLSHPSSNELGVFYQSISQSEGEEGVGKLVLRVRSPFRKLRESLYHFILKAFRGILLHDIQSVLG